MSYQIDDIVKLNDLFDIYHPLLTDKQQAYFQYYFREDYSLSEIADIMDVSRNAVHLQIKKITTYLNDYEKKLKLFHKNIQRNQIIDSLQANHDLTDQVKKELEKLKKV